MSSHVVLLGVALWCAFIAGCTYSPRVVPIAQQKPIDRAIVDTPAGTVLVVEMDGLTAPTSICIDNGEGEYKGTVLVAEGGIGGFGPRIVGIKPDRTLVEVYPKGKLLPRTLRFLSP